MRGIRMWALSAPGFRSGARNGRSHSLSRTIPSGVSRTPHSFSLRTARYGRCTLHSSPARRVRTTCSIPPSCAARRAQTAEKRGAITTLCSRGRERSAASQFRSSPTGGGSSATGSAPTAKMVLRVTPRCSRSPTTKGKPGARWRCREARGASMRMWSSSKKAI